MKDSSVLFSYYGRRIESYELMAEYLAEPMIKWIEMRRSIFQEPPVRALTMREREHIALAMELIAHKPN